jgi:hypothetical protein
MSTDLAITAVTATLRQLLDDEIAEQWGSTVLGGELIKEFVVTHQLPHKVRTGANETKNVINLFLYRTELNAAWRNMPDPSQTKPGEHGAPPLALNLDYLLTAYGEDEREEAAHYFLGQAMRVLHDNAVVPRSKFNDVIPEALVHRQIEKITITPRPLTIEDLSKLWSMFQTQFRICAAYVVTVVLIDNRTATKSAPPVLKRGPDDSGITALASAPPTLDHARAESGFAAVHLNEALILTGERLDGGGLSALLHHPTFSAPEELPVTPIDATHVKVTIPNAAADWPAGLYSISLLITRPGMAKWTTNSVAFGLAPTITFTSPVTVNDEVTLTVSPEIRPAQNVIVILGSEQFTPTSITATEVKFDATVEGEHLVRLRIDGVDSIPVEKDANGILQFKTNQILEVTP